MTRVRPAAKFLRATAVVVSMAIAINPVDKSLIVVIELVLLALDGEAGEAHREGFPEDGAG
jgi:hypothetical protein